MKLASFLMLLCLSATYATPALARRWVPATNASMSTDLMPSGDLMIKVTMPDNEYVGLGRDMRPGHGSCRIVEVDRSAMTSLIFACTKD
jgi:hypothetical protein